MISTQTCIDRECFNLRGEDRLRLTDIDAAIDYEMVASVVNVLADESPEFLSTTVITADARQVTLDVGERTIAGAVYDDNDAVIVVNDEDAFDALQSLVESGHIEAIPMMSLQLARQMYECRALRFDDIELLCSQVTADIERLTTMSESKVNRKVAHAESVISAVALEEARRNAQDTVRK